MSIEEMGIKIRVDMATYGIRVGDIAKKMGVRSNTVSTFLRPQNYAAQQLRIAEAIEGLK